MVHEERRGQFLKEHDRLLRSIRVSAAHSAWLANAGSGKGCSVQKHWAADGSAPAGSCAVTAARYLLLTAVVFDAW